jgi:hypothetical protein
MVYGYAPSQICLHASGMVKSSPEVDGWWCGSLHRPACVWACGWGDGGLGSGGGVGWGELGVKTKGEGGGLGLTTWTALCACLRRVSYLCIPCMLLVRVTAVLLMLTSACVCVSLQIDWFEVYLQAQEERGFEGSFRMFLDLQVGGGVLPGGRYGGGTGGEEAYQWVTY